MKGPGGAVHDGQDRHDGVCGPRESIARVLHLVAEDNCRLEAAVEADAEDETDAVSLFSGEEVSRIAPDPIRR